MTQVLVVGDVMLDRYWHGEVTRISPEAPVPVVRLTSTDDRLGGAANVAANLVAMGVPTTLIGAVGMDDAGAILSRLAQNAGIETGWLCGDSSTKTTVKLRVLGHNQQMLRLDTEGSHGEDARAQIYQATDENLPECDIAVLSDYGKGALQDADQLIAAAIDRGTPVFVDPKGTDWAKYAGASMIKPNEAELRAMVGTWADLTDMSDKASALRRSLSIEVMVITLGARGMVLLTERGSLFQGARAHGVYDVTGAGDTVMAALAARRAMGESWERALQYASAAASIAVGRLGTTAASAKDVCAIL